MPIVKALVADMFTKGDSNRFPFKMTNIFSRCAVTSKEMLFERTSLTVQNHDGGAAFTVGSLETPKKKNFSQNGPFPDGQAG